MPTPGVDAAALGKLFEQGGVLGFLDLFAGGALRRFSIFALGVTPYINSSIVMQLLAVVVPSLEKMQKEGEEGRKKVVQYTRYGTIIFALIQAVGMTGWLRNLGIFTGSWMDIALVAVTLTTGAVAVMWLGEVMSDHGIGNGISLLIFAGIVARIPEAIIRTFTLVRLGEMNILILVLAVVLMIAVVAGCVMLQEGQRRLPVQYAKRMVGRKMYGGTSTYLPLKVNQAGVIPVIFASSLIYIPHLVTQLIQSGRKTPSNNWWDRFVADYLTNPADPVYIGIYFALIIFFTYFYVSITFNPDERADEMKKFGGFIPGIRPGKPTADYLRYVLNRITLPGSIYLGVIAVLPNVFLQMGNSGGIQNLPFGGTAVLIMIGVGLDTVKQIESQLMQRNYEGFLK